MTFFEVAARDDDAVEVVEASEQAECVVDGRLGAVGFIEDLQDEFRHIVLEGFHLQVEGAFGIALAFDLRGLVDLVFVDAELIFPAALRLVERAVGMLEKLAVGESVVGVEGDAHADGEREASPFRAVVMMHGLDEIGAMTADAVEICGMRQEDDELIAADAPFDV